jgi:hypothetical protein
MELLYKFWNANSEKQSSENWPAGNTYVNHWEGDSYMVSVEDSNLEHGGFLLKQMIWNAARDTIQEWTGQKMAECSLYGIRVYKEGAVLAPHVDRLPLVSSAIINVAQDVDEPWYVLKLSWQQEFRRVVAFLCSPVYCTHVNPQATRSDRS